ncbi:SRPBCC family protein [Caulobacter segnis]|uniref:SRPBCC family protein n=1 Tax=Caulobacter segnis TaxID=88688 RepID=UPI001CC02A4E|nr:SRPBCC family protein [Caulobacter segnis]UAL11365.1 SRPBCC family protein [Caulobacter segnis]
MASVHKEILIEASPEAVWDAVRDVGRIHERLCPGFVVNTEMVDDGAARLVTFGNGMVVKEVIVDSDDARRRLVWTVRSERLAHHNGVMRIEDAGQGRSRALWTADVLPHAAADAVGPMMQQGLEAMKRRLDEAG